MFKKTITYTDFNDIEHTEDFYFNLNKAEIALLEVSTPGGLKAYAENLIATRDVKRIAELFQELVTMSYGVKSPDGLRFIKSKEMAEEFTQTNAYAELIAEIISDAEAGASFFNGLAESVTASGKKNDREHKTLAVVSQ